MINCSRIASKFYSNYFVKPSYENLTSGPKINVWYEDDNFLMTNPVPLKSLATRFKQITSVRYEAVVLIENQNLQFFL